MTGLFRLTITELRLFLRDGTAVFVVLGMPIGLLLIFGSMVDSTNPSGDIRASEGFFSAMALALSIGMLGLFTIPTYLGTYREKGILRRLSLTPVHPAMLLGAQLMVNMMMAFVGMLLVMLVGNLGLAISMPQDVLGFLIAFVLSASALFMVGLLLAAVAPSGRAAGGLGSLLNFPLLFFAGVWMPKEQMSTILARIADFTPLSAAMDTLRDTWQGNPPQLFDVVVLATTTLIVGLVAVRSFRWD